MLINGKTNVLEKFITFEQTELKKLNVKKTRVLSYHIGSNNCAYVPIKSFEKETVGTRECYEVCFENNMGIKYTIVCDENTYVYTSNKGYVKAPYLNLSSICMDNRGITCKVLSVNKKKVSPETEIFDIKTEYNSNFFYEGILLK